MQNTSINNKVTVVLSANNSYSPYLATTIKSIIDNTSATRQYEIIVLHASISELNQQIISDLALEYDNIEIVFINLKSQVKGKKFFIGGKKDLTIETYFRLFIPRVLPNHDKVIYLDCDMIVCVDIAELYDTDLSGKLFASSQDYGAIGKYYMNDKKQIDYWHNELQLTNIEEYFCAGMIVMNLTELRKIGVNTILTLATQKNWQKHDQDVLNILGRNKTIILHPKWDVLKAFDEVQYLPDYIMDKVKEAEKNPYIVHFSSSYKPWNTGFVDRFELFWEYASKTPYFYDIVKSLYKNRPYQCYILQHFSEDKQITRLPIPNDIMISYGKEDIYLGKISGGYTTISSIIIVNNTLQIRGKTMLMSFDKTNDIKVFIEANNKKYISTLLNGDFSEIKLGIDSYFGVGFTCEIPLNNILSKTELKVFCSVDGAMVLKTNLNFGKYAPLSKNLKSSYYFNNGFVITHNGKSLFIQKCNHKERKTFEKNFIEEIKQQNSVASKKAILVRKAFCIFNQLSKKEIWLFSDRANKADDNGEALFRYVRKIKPRGVKAYYAIDKRSSDYSRMKKLGDVVNISSWKYKWLFLNSSFKISSQADDITIYPFKNSTEYYKDLIANSKFVFLQHGVIKEDMSHTYNRTNQNMSIFVTAAEPEYQSIITNPQYDCDASITKLTGLPRHDRLYHDEKKIILLMPTWRKYLFQHSATYDGVWEPKETFKHSDYFKFYNGLINNSRLLDALKTYNYKLCFMPHPNVHGAAHLFNKPKNVEILPLSTPYSKIFAEGKLVITDRSSAIMDFAYLRKPVLYCLFDDDNFMAGEHVYTKGYFDYEKDGFGEVAYNLEDTVDNIIEYLKNDCAIKPLYKQRIDSFFAYTDKNNCKRVYDEIVKLRTK